MRSKIEEKLDKEFEKRGLKPKIYHFMGNDIVYPYAGITIADVKHGTYEGTLKYVIRTIDKSFDLDHNLASHLKADLNFGGWGVAICDKRDTFNRQRGRIIAKGRLLKNLKKEANSEK